MAQPGIALAAQAAVCVARGTTLPGRRRPVDERARREPTMSQDLRFVPLEVRAPRGAESTEIRWADGHVATYPNELLRGYCPCAGCQGHEGRIKFIAGGNSVLESLEEVGNYGLALGWGDGHDSGIFTYRYLRELCCCDACLPGSAHERRAPLGR